MYPEYKELLQLRNEKITKQTNKQEENIKKGAKDFNSPFKREDSSVLNNHMKKYSTSLVMRKMKNKTRRMTKIEKVDDT